jgi:predicted O-methyltransferase YrrM
VKLEAVLRELEDFAKKNRRWNVPPEHGRYLWLMTELVGAKRVLEVGTSNGYSSIWMCRGLRTNGGKLVTIEIDEGRANEARANFKKAGVDDLITLHRGDANKVIPTLSGSFDMVFIDANKDGYKAYFEMTYPMVKPGGLILAHNAITLADQMEDFLERVQTHPGLITNIVQIGQDGFAVSYKKKSP